MFFPVSKLSKRNSDTDALFGMKILKSPRRPIRSKLRPRTPPKNPGGLWASNLAPTWRPRGFQKAPRERLRGVWEAPWKQEVPKSRPERPPDLKCGPPDIDFGPHVDALWNRFQMVFGHHFRSFLNFLHHLRKPAKVTCFRGVLGANSL